MVQPASPALVRLATAAVGLALLVPAGLAVYFLVPVGGAVEGSPKTDVVLRTLEKRVEDGPSLQVPTPPAPPPIAQPLRVSSVISRPDVFDYGMHLWRDDPKTSGGPVVVTVDLKSQLLRVWRGGHEIGVATILYGAPDSPTPTGSFPITQKSRDHVSNIYDTPMPFALRLTNDGVMVHASNVRTGWASNGCVGIPKDFARQLFDVVKLGDRVVITDGKPLLDVGDPLPPV